MSFTLGIFDLFAYAVPGSLYLGVLAYISNRLGWVNLGFMLKLNTTIFLIATALASYLLGHITYQLGQFIDRKLPLWRKGLPNARQEFLARVPGPKAKFLAQTDSFLLLAAAETRTTEAAVEISRIRASGLMLRNSFPPLILAFAVSLAELVAGSNRIFAASSAVVFLLAAIGALRHGRTLAEWAVAKTLQVAFWTIKASDIRSAESPAERSTGAQTAQPIQRPGVEN